MLYSPKVVYPKLSYTVTGILYKTHNDLGRYCNEKQYADKVEEYLREYKIPYEREKILAISFNGERSGRNKIDFEIGGKIILEIKTKRTVFKEDYFQVKRYLQAADKKLGILVNFRERFIHPHRILNSSFKG